MNKSAVKQFAVAARKLLTDALTQRAIEHGITDGAAKTAEEAAYFWFSRFTAFHYLEVNGYLPSGIRFYPEGNRALQSMFPEVFGQVTDRLALLLPEHLLDADGTLTRMLREIPEEDWRGQVQILGWLYQYYNTERKDQVFAGLRNNIKITAETLPAATQLFTPDWIARCLAENALGRLWAEGHGKPDHADWRYYIEETEQTPAVIEALGTLRAHYRTLRPEDIRIIDPCMGSGHILLCAFDVLMDIYTSCGWSEQDAARSIVERNLWGLDIDRHVYQLAYVSLLMKARQYTPDLQELRPHLACFADVADLGGETFRHADVYGSLMEIPFAAPPDAPRPVADICRILSQDYDVVITNPPYMGSSSMDPVLSAFVREHYPDSKSDLFACFIEKCRKLTRPQGFYALLTMQSWMFLLSFGRLRDSLMENDVVSLMHLGANAFDQGDVGTIVQAAAFVMRKTNLTAYRGTYLALDAPARPEDKIAAFFAPENRHYVSKEQFLRIPGHPLVYWASEQMLRHFSGEKLGDHAAARQGMTTSDNDRFIRRWYETAFHAICFDAKSSEDARRSGKKWFPYNKGGGYRKWYGNHEYVVNFGDDGREMKAFHRELNKTRSGGRIKNTEYYFKRAIAWNFIALTPGFRCRPDGFIFDVAGSSLFVEDDRIEYMMAYLCSKVADCFLHILNPTMNVQANDIKSLPYIEQENETVRLYTRENIALCKADWDAFETSWDFARHPLLPTPEQRKSGSILLDSQFRIWEQTCETRFRKLKTNEETLNRIFISIYDLQDELTPEVGERTITVRRADRCREIRSLLSYAVGCLFGRYSPDHDGILCAGGELEPALYRTIVPVKDGILPVTADAVFENDLTERVIDFLRAVFGSETLEENLSYIAKALGGRGEPREVLRSYLLNGFFADHCRIYQKRPIYWMFSSGRKNGFKALVYLHRWQKTTITELCSRYLPDMEAYYRAQLAGLEREMQSAPAAGQAKLRKQIAGISDRLAEVAAYGTKLRPLAEQMPVIDLDDGVRANYQRFGDLLERIRG